MITYPAIDPIAFQVGPLAVRWYGLSYLTGIFLGYLFIKDDLIVPHDIINQKCLVHVHKLQYRLQVSYH